MKRSLLVWASCLLISSFTAAQNAPASRDPWLWPFSQDSIWNRPIGSDAQYESASLPASYYIGCDIEWHCKTVESDPVVTVYSPSSWSKRWPGDRELGELRIPAGLIIPDASPPHTPNACAVFLMPDGRTIRQLEPACRVESIGRIVGWLHHEDQDLYGAGIKGTHYGSGLSAIGGSIRIGELSGDEPIHHVLKINVWGKYLNYSDDNHGFRWPADRSDSYASRNYKGSNPQLVMGTLLALPPDLTPEDVGASTQVGLKLFHALQDYGAYISDDSAWNAYDLCVERGVPEEVEKTYEFALTGSEGVFVDEMKRMVTHLAIVVNNSPDSIGGGGKPRQPLAPPISAP